MTEVLDREREETKRHREGRVKRGTEIGMLGVAGRHQKPGGCNKG